MHKLLAAHREEGFGSIRSLRMNGYGPSMNRLGAFMTLSKDAYNQKTGERIRIFTSSGPKPFSIRCHSNNLLDDYMIQLKSFFNPELQTQNNSQPNEEQKLERDSSLDRKAFSKLNGAFGADDNNRAQTLIESILTLGTHVAEVGIDVSDVARLMGQLEKKGVKSGPQENSVYVLGENSHLSYHFYPEGMALDSISGIPSNFISLPIPDSNNTAIISGVETVVTNLISDQNLDSVSRVFPDTVSAPDMSVLTTIDSPFEMKVLGSQSSNGYNSLFQFNWPREDVSRGVQALLTLDKSVFKDTDNIVDIVTNKIPNNQIANGLKSANGAYVQYVSATVAKDVSLGDAMAHVRSKGMEFAPAPLPSYYVPLYKQLGLAGMVPLLFSIVDFGVDNNIPSSVLDAFGNFDKPYDDIRNNVRDALVAKYGDSKVPVSESKEGEMRDASPLHTTEQLTEIEEYQSACPGVSFDEACIDLGLPTPNDIIAPLNAISVPSLRVARVDDIDAKFSDLMTALNKIILMFNTSDDMLRPTVISTLSDMTSIPKDIKATLFEGSDKKSKGQKVINRIVTLINEIKSQLKEAKEKQYLLSSHIDTLSGESRWELLAQSFTMRLPGNIDGTSFSEGHETFFLQLTKHLGLMPSGSISTNDTSANRNRFSLANFPQLMLSLDKSLDNADLRRAEKSNNMEQLPLLGTKLDNKEQGVLGMLSTRMANVRESGITESSSPNLFSSFRYLSQMYKRGGVDLDAMVESDLEAIHAAKIEEERETAALLAEMLADGSGSESESDSD
jgi:hypothetical protein